MKLLNEGRAKKQPDVPLCDLFKFFKTLNTAPESTENEQGYFPLGERINFDAFNEEINAYITKDEIFACIKTEK